MSDTPNSICLGNGCSGRNVLILPEGAEIRQLAHLVGAIFQVPVAYAAMLGHHDQVMSRIGTGEEFWKYLKITVPLDAALTSATIVCNSSAEFPGTAAGSLHFVATAPMRTLCGQNLGILVIASPAARPAFSARDLDVLKNLADIIAGRLEIRMIAAQAFDAKLRLEEAEERYQAAAHLAPELISCHSADGRCLFVNAAWLAFTGRLPENEFGDGWQDIAHPDFSAVFLNAFWRALQTRQSVRIAVPIKRGDGAYRWMRGTGVPRCLRDGTLAGISLTLADSGDYHET